jgi:alkane 1-monooxygenase
MGLCCGVTGINVAHELGHRSKKYEKNMAKSLLMTSLYMHFFIEHNKGHHKNVGTVEDSVTARKNEWLIMFWFRSISGVFRNAWSISNKESLKKYGKLFSLKNEMIQFTLIQLIWVLTIVLFFGWRVTLYYLLACMVGYLLLETVEYIEHYGLARKKVSEFRYENTQPKHSWNSDHQWGRLLLFELSRHSDHHYKVFKKYQTLDHHDNSPQMPTGYPGMMLLALISPLWFKIMNPRVDQWNE